MCGGGGGEEGRILVVFVQQMETKKGRGRRKKKKMWGAGEITFLFLHLFFSSTSSLSFLLVKNNHKELKLGL